MLATLIRLLGDFDLAEEALQEAFAAAIEQWPSRGTPQNPRAWLISAGRNKAIDRIRRDVVFKTKISEGLADMESSSEDQDAGEEVFGDDRLRLIFTCCHPALNQEAQIALTLREVCGLSTQAVARAFLVGEETMAQRLVRAKKKIRDAQNTLCNPRSIHVGAASRGRACRRVRGIHRGVRRHQRRAAHRRRVVRRSFIRLGRLLDTLLPNRAAVMGLLALMLLHDARRASRVSSAGDLVLLDTQDRSQWDRGEIAQGLQLVEKALSIRGQVSAYAVQAAIAALHVKESDSRATDWPQIVGLYEVLLRLQPTPVVELNHAVAVSMVDGAARALDLVDSLAARGEVRQYHLLHATRGRFLQDLGRHDEARAAYALALDTAELEPEAAFSQRPHCCDSGNLRRAYFRVTGGGQRGTAGLGTGRFVGRGRYFLRRN